MTATSTEPSPSSRVCANCGAAMLGDHCYRCGQPVKGLVRHFGSIVSDFLDSVFDFDSRTFRTLGPLLYRPGFLSREYIAGRRVRYVSPVRLFVFLCIVSFFVLQLWVDPEMDGVVQLGNSEFSGLSDVAEIERRRDEAIAGLEAGRAALEGNPGGQAGMDAGIAAIRASAQRRIDEIQDDSGNTRPSMREPRAAPRPGISFGDRPWDAETNPLRFESMPQGFNDWLNRMVGRAATNIEKVQAEPRLLAETFLQTLPQTFFVLLPVFALLLKLAYLLQRRLYMEHLIVALHCHAFLCLSLLLVVGLDALRGLFEPGLAHSLFTGAERALFAWMPIYLFIAQKRVYGQGWIMTSLKFALLGFAYMLLLLFGALINLAFSLVLM